MFEKIRNSWVIFVGKVPSVVKIIIFAVLIVSILFLLYRLLLKHTPNKPYDMGKFYWVLVLVIITVVLGLVGFFDFF